MFLVMLAIVLLLNCVTKFAGNNYNGIYYYYEDINYLKQEISKYNPEIPTQAGDYVFFATEIEVVELITKYSENSWKINIIQNFAYPIISDVNHAKFIEKDEISYQANLKILNDFKQKLENNDWQYFANQEKIQAEENVKNIENELKATTSDTREKELKKSYEQALLILDVAKMRIDRNIDYSNSYLSNALYEYQHALSYLIEYDGNTNLTYDEKLLIQQQQESAALAKYIIDNHQDIYQNNTFRSGIMTLVDNYSWIIIVMIIIVAGSIVAEEFSKGTIKLLLIKPYTRRKILRAKFITSLLMILITFITITVFQFIIGFLLFGLDSLSIPAVIYNFSTNSIETLNVFGYLLIKIIGYLPQAILLLTLSFGLSAIFTNTALATALPIMGIITGGIINQLVTYYNVTWMKYFVTLNWDTFSMFFGRLSAFEPISLISSLITCLIYFIIMIIPTFIIFKKKNIKNI